MTHPTEEHCARCRRSAPDQESGDFLEWEAMSDGIVCPGCLTGEEENAFFDDFAELAEQSSHCARCGREVPDVSGEQMEAEGWDTPDSAGARWVCPDCRTGVDARELNDVASALKDTRTQGPDGQS